MSVLRDTEFRGKVRVHSQQQICAMRFAYGCEIHFLSGLDTFEEDMGNVTEIVEPILVCEAMFFDLKFLVLCSFKHRRSVPIASVGWVEQRDTHRSSSVCPDGYRCAPPILPR